MSGRKFIIKNDHGGIFLGDRYLHFFNFAAADKGSVIRLVKSLIGTPDYIETRRIRQAGQYLPVQRDVACENGDVCIAVNVNLLQQLFNIPRQIKIGVRDVLRRHQFDAIVVALGGSDPPEPLLSQLSIDGRLVMPLAVWLVGILPVTVYPFMGGKVWCRYWCPLVVTWFSATTPTQGRTAA